MKKKTTTSAQFQFLVDAQFRFVRTGGWGRGHSPATARVLEGLGLVTKSWDATRRCFVYIATMEGRDVVARWGVLAA